MRPRPRAAARDFNGSWEQLNELIELREARPERHVARDFELEAEAEAVDAVRVMDGAHRQQVLKELCGEGEGG